MSLDAHFKCDEQTYVSGVTQTGVFLKAALRAKERIDATKIVHTDVAHLAEQMSKMTNGRISKNAAEKLFLDIDMVPHRDPYIEYDFISETCSSKRPIPTVGLRTLKLVDSLNRRRQDPQYKSNALRTLKYDMVDIDYVTIDGYPILNKNAALMKEEIDEQVRQIVMSNPEHADLDHLESMCANGNLGKGRVDEIPGMFEFIKMEIEEEEDYVPRPIVIEDNQKPPVIEEDLNYSTNGNIDNNHNADNIVIYNLYDDTNYADSQTAVKQEIMNDSYQITDLDCPYDNQIQTPRSSIENAHFSNFDLCSSVPEAPNDQVPSQKMEIIDDLSDLSSGIGSFMAGNSLDPSTPLKSDLPDLESELADDIVIYDERGFPYDSQIQNISWTDIDPINSTKQEMNKGNYESSQGTTQNHKESAHQILSEQLMTSQKPEIIDQQEVYITKHEVSSQKSLTTEQRFFQEQKLDGDPASQNVVLHINIFVGYSRSLEYHEVRLGRLLKPTHTVRLLGSHTLGDLRNSFTCPNDYTFDDDLSIRKPRKIDVSKYKYPSSFFFIHDTFYVDSSVPQSLAIAENVREYFLRPANNKSLSAPMEMGDMNSTRLVDLTLRFGQPYVFIHQGCCEHLVVFNEMHLRSSLDRAQIKDYPLVLYEKTFKQVLCAGCKLTHAEHCIEISVENRPFLLTESPCFLCSQCYKEFCFKKLPSGRSIKQFEFRAVPFIDRKAVERTGRFLKHLNMGNLDDRVEE